MESAGAAAAPAVITRYQYAMALPSQDVQYAPQAAAKGTASGARPGSDPAPPGP